MFIYSDTKAKDVKMIQIGVESDADEWYMVDADDGHRLTAAEFEYLMGYHVPIVAVLPNVLGYKFWVFASDYCYNIDGGYYSATFRVGNMDPYIAYTAELPITAENEGD